MTISDFPQFYRAVHKKDPFPWQNRLATTVHNHGWPETIALPTAAGKTSVLDVAVFCLALEAGSKERKAALRTFIVIDRRIVVDEAAQHAVEIAEALAAANDGIVREAADRLRSFGAGCPLEVAALRGGMYRDQTWADRPNQPLICVSTVDQVGSRLLFRGYQLSESQRPVHAALVGMDSLIILDEAHLSGAFAETVSAIRKYQQWADSPPARGVAFVQMSATTNGAAPFSPNVDDYDNPELSRRWSARKLVAVKESTSFEDDALRSALALAQDSDAKVIGVVVNRVRSARAIFELMKVRGKHETVLLTGRVRPYDRDLMLNRFLSRMKAGRDRLKDTPLFVIATQTVEVGANLDFDALVSEAAPLDALRQRFGRLNRLGQLSTTRGVLLLRKGSLDGKDKIYGQALSDTWRWLSTLAEEQGGDVDFGIAAMDRSVATANTQFLFSKTDSAPLLFPAHVYSWVQTNPTPAPDPDVAPFLHGPDALNATDVQIVWRADLDPAHPEHWESTVLAAPPISREALPVPFIAVKKWLAHEKTSEVTDVEGIPTDTTDSDTPEGRQFIVWTGADRVTLGNRLIPGTTILVPSTYGGCDEYGWVPESERPVIDIGDATWNEAAEVGLRRHRIRIHQGVLFTSPNEQFRQLVQQIQAAEENDNPIGSVRDELLNYVRFTVDTPWIQSALDFIGEAALQPYGADAYVLMARRKRPARSVPRLGIREMRLEETDEDDLASFTGTITLSKHTAGVMKTVGHFARNMGLTPDLVAALENAAEFHDLGKCDERFQTMLQGGSISRAMAASEPLAKSTYDGAAQYKLARSRAGYPKGARHEFTSAALVADSDRMTGPAADLVLHLIGSHHGYGRPIPPVCVDNEPVQVTAPVNSHTVCVSSRHELWRLDSGWIDRFWSLNRRYGYWGLAYLEMILRRADCVQSRSEQESA